jgi:hypothetical protein
MAVIPELAVAKQLLDAAKPTGRLRAHWKKAIKSRGGGSGVDDDRGEHLSHFAWDSAIVCCPLAYICHPGEPGLLAQ